MDKTIISALVTGDQTVTYRDGNTAPLHQTLVYLGDFFGITEGEHRSILRVVQLLASHTRPITATVSGRGVIGEDDEPMVLTESLDLVDLRDRLLREPVIRNAYLRTKQYPNWVSHVSGLPGLPHGTPLIFDRVMVAFGDMQNIFPFASPRLVLGPSQ